MTCSSMDSFNHHDHVGGSRRFHHPPVNRWQESLPPMRLMWMMPCRQPVMPCRGGRDSVGRNVPSICSGLPGEYRSGHVNCPSWRRWMAASRSRNPGILIFPSQLDTSSITPVGLTSFAGPLRERMHDLLESAVRSFPGISLCSWLHGRSLLHLHAETPVFSSPLKQRR